MYQIGEPELKAVERVFNKRRLFRYQYDKNSECDLFESEFAKKIGTRFSLLVTSGTNALTVALSACAVGPGDEVIIPAYTFVATAIAVTSVGAIPIIANIDETLGISPEEIEKLITDRTKAIIPVHMDGLCADMDSVMKIAKKHRLHVIEDVAQALGGSFCGRRLGSIGSFGCFSLNESKNISCGEGGVVTTSIRAYYEHAYCMQDASAQFNPNTKEIFQKTVPFMGASMRVSEVTGAIMRVQLTRLDKIISGLRRRKKVFLTELAELDTSNHSSVILGNCAQGDCSSSLHLLFSDPEAAAFYGKNLRKKGLLFAPVTSRIAHACWKWTHLLREDVHYQGGRNPYRETDRKYSYSTAQYLQSVSILTRTLKMDLDLSMSLKSLEQTRELARQVAKVLRN